mgnify:CR=1 FL=1
MGKVQNLLLITSSGGGGHLQAAKAKIASIRSSNPNAIIYQQDLLLDWLGPVIGRLFGWIWNFSMKKGWVVMQERLQQSQRILDITFWPVIFTHAFAQLIRKNIDQIIDTQPLGTSAIIKATRLASFWTKKPLFVEKVITELPTEEVTHFFKPIKRLSDKDRLFLRIISAKPLAWDSAKQFWLKACNIDETNVSYEGLPLRPAFYKYIDKVPSTIPLSVSIQSPYHRKMILESIHRGSIKTDIQNDIIYFILDPDEYVFTLMLGSQPTEKATIQYVKNFISFYRKNQVLKKSHLFVLCGHYYRSCPLLHKIYNLICSVEEYPNKLTIIPLPFQDDTIIAPLFSRSNATFTRSGGITSLELMAVARGSIWIHMEQHSDSKLLRKPYPYMVSWERGNAFYLYSIKGAQFITPDKLFTVLSQVVSDLSRQATLPSHVDPET